MRYQANGKPELHLRVAVPNGEREGTQFFLPFDVIVYGKDCEPLAELLEAGDLVELTGQNAWPKAPKEPGGKWIPAVICFGVDPAGRRLPANTKPPLSMDMRGDDAALTHERASVPETHKGKPQPTGAQTRGRH